MDPNTENTENLDTMFEDAVTTEQPAEQPAEEQKPEQDTQERARQAEGRRIREREQRSYNAGYAKAREEMSALIKRVGITNSKDEVIDTVDALEEYERAQSDSRLSSGNGNADDLRRIVREELQQAARPQGNSPEEDAEVQRQLAQIRAMDPAMTDLGAILNSEAGAKFRGYVEKGLDFVDAYTLAAKDRLGAISANRAGAKGGDKSHLSATQQQGTGALSVPADELAIFRELNPGVSDADIQKYYNADRKRYGPK